MKAFNIADYMNDAVSIDHRNREWFKKSYATIQETLSKDWNLECVDYGCGGFIKAQNRKYPNVYFELPIYYNGLHDEKFPANITATFYLDEKHCSNIDFSFICILSENKDVPYRKMAINDLNTIVEKMVSNYCNEHNITSLTENEFLAITSNHIISINQEQAKRMNLSKGATNKWTITERIRDDFNLPTPMVSVYNTDLELNDKQRMLLKMFTKLKQEKNE